MKISRLEMAIDLYIKRVYEDIEKGRPDVKMVDALDSLVRTWGMIQTTENAKNLADSVRSITNKSPELPFEFTRVNAL